MGKHTEGSFCYRLGIPVNYPAALNFLGRELLASKRKIIRTKTISNLYVGRRCCQRNSANDVTFFNRLSAGYVRVYKEPDTTYTTCLLVSMDATFVKVHRTGPGSLSPFNEFITFSVYITRTDRLHSYISNLITCHDS